MFYQVSMIILNRTVIYDENLLETSVNRVFSYL